MYDLVLFRYDLFILKIGFQILLSYRYQIKATFPQKNML
ncbi:hypothetical protein XM78_u0004 [Vibrio vulnificus]|nr:hypothetical protein XM78_u0004 [Vibrio vulnificus]